MLKLRSVRYIVLALLLMVTPLAAQDDGPPQVGFRPDAPTYALRGPHWVGVMEFVLDSESERPVPVTVWYPALNPEGLAEEITYDAGVADILTGIPDPMKVFPGRAILNAAPDPGAQPYPLVINSHGGTASRFFTAYYQEHLASHGFVVMAPEHAGSAYLDFFITPPDELPTRLAQNVPYRLLDVIHVLDFAEGLTATGGELEGLIDMDRVAITGYSMGGATALMAAGARFDFDSLPAFCADASHEAIPGYGESCASLENKEQYAEVLGIEAGTEGLWPSVGDSRVDAIIMEAPGRGAVFGAAGLANITVPALTLYGTNDQVIGGTDNAVFAYNRLSSDQKALITFENGNHYIFGDCPPFWVAGGFAFCFDAVWDTARVHDLANHFSTAFLLDVLKGDADAHNALAPDTVTFPGITYEAVGF